MSFHEDGCGYNTKEERIRNGQEAFLISMFLFLLFSLVELGASIYPLMVSGELHPVITLISVWGCLLSIIYWSRMRKIYKEAKRHLFYNEELAYFSGARATLCIGCALGIPTVCSIMGLICYALYPPLRTYVVPSTLLLLVCFAVNAGISFHFDTD